MATIEKSVLRLEFDNGIIDGKQKYKASSFSNLKHDATDQNILQTSRAINALTQPEVLRTTTVVTSLIEE